VNPRRTRLRDLASRATTARRCAGRVRTSRRPGTSPTTLSLTCAASPVIRVPSRPDHRLAPPPPARPAWAAAAVARRGAVPKPGQRQESGGCGRRPALAAVASPDFMDLNKWWICPLPDRRCRHPAGPWPGPARWRAPVRRHAIPRVSGDLMDVNKWWIRDSARPGQRPASGSGGRSRRPALAAVASPDFMDLNKWWICPLPDRRCRLPQSWALARASPLASRRCAGTPVSDFRVIPWT